jgi:hypothetical protein
MVAKHASHAGQAGPQPEEPIMSTVKPITAQQQRVRDLQDRVTHADLSYFAQLPHCKHPGRVADTAEIELAELIGTDMSLVPGKQHYIGCLARVEMFAITEALK